MATPAAQEADAGTAPVTPNGSTTPDSSGPEDGVTSAPASAARNAVGLPQVIEAAVLNDPRIRAAFSEVLRARAELLKQSVFDNPGLTASQTLNPFAGHSFTPTRQGGPPQLDLGVNYSLERLLFGQRRAGMEAADRKLQAELAAYSEVARGRVFEAIAAYVDVLETRELSLLAGQQVEQLERLESITSRRVTLGSVGQVELNRVHIAVINGRRRALSAQVEKDNALTRLRARLGPPYARQSVEVPDTLDLTPREPPPFEPLLARALALRPDLIAQERRLVAAQAEQKHQERLALPKVNVGAGYTRQFQENTIGFPNASSWGATLQTTLPVFDRNRGGIAAAQADIFQAEATIAALRLEVSSDLEQALRSLSAAEQNLAFFDADAMRSAESARNTIEEAYGLGGRTLLELLDAQQVYREVYREHVFARSEYMRAIHRLNAIVGEEVFK
jgi:cobalt-zinc-cadmium efflux system outer membrane protein